MIAVYHTAETADTLVNSLHSIKARLGDDLIYSIFQVLLIDRGSEFSNAKEIEELVGTLFYFDPMAFWQKPHVENNHRLFRYICPKEKNLHQLGLHSQKDLDLIFSHINSYPHQERHGKSPIDELTFYHKEASLI